MFKLLAVLPVLFLSFAMSLAQPANVTGLSFQLVALSRVPDWDAGNGSSYTAEDLRPLALMPSDYVHGVFVSIGIGQGGRRKVLALDTSASTSWVMCEPCHPPLHQVGRLFSPAASPTFRGVHSNDPVCVPPYHRLHSANGCSFAFPSATGYLARDTFHLRHSGRSAVKSISDVAFGCAHTTIGFYNEDILGGVLSLSTTPLSFLTQFGSRAGGRFSYCLPDPTTSRNPSGFIQFGIEVPSLPRDAHTTTLTASASGYHLSLIGISLGNKRLDIERHVFTRHGCSINPAETITKIVEPAYLVVARELVAQMNELGSKQVKGPRGGPLVFNKISRTARTRLPSMVFHFADGGDMWFTAGKLFLVIGTTARFLVEGHGSHRTVIGAAQQVNARFIFNVAAGRLTFAEELCSRDAA
ncbi:aspartyl protease family protein 2-like [Aegilops tauschii subsp. strangulata]|uniref:Peptidase A1 domain-containing protein n=1 Tax=Aegilops tauschii subsp. strangulata TaxID=200361 RepID=A0A453MJH3_AEGTS|nr:aspartyl protease AED1-like [Aegilops tauschii subsp. strangulata]